MRKHAPVVGTALLLILIFTAAPIYGDEEEQAVMALPVHSLGDQTLSISAGVFIPLFFQRFTLPFQYLPMTLNRLGGTGTLQWNAYLGPYFRMGIEVSTAFSVDPNRNPLVMLPITIKGAYVLNVSRFEFPFFLSAGINIIRYQDWSHLDLIFKPGFAAYWRYDANWSFGVNFTWWLDMQFEGADSMMLNALEVTPSVFYHF